MFLLLASALAGCAGTLPRNAVPEALVTRAAIGGMPLVRYWGDASAAELDIIVARTLHQFRSSSKRPPGRRDKIENFLALSGGGSDGAFGAGLLVGWTEAGTRPRFKVVTGISTGALIAPFAFLGSEYDHVLETIYTRYGTKDLIDLQPVAALLGAPAVADNSRMVELLNRYVDRKLLAAVAREYRKGRWLLVGTTNLDAQRPVIWNMGGIADSGHPRALELFRKVLLASAAIPGVFPPVMINVEAGGRRFEELHVDGGATKEVFLAPAQFMFSSIDRRLGYRPVRNLYVVCNCRLQPQWKAVKASALKVASRSISTLIKNQGISDIALLFERSRRQNFRFHLAAIPSDFKKVSSEPFDQIYMRALFERARDLGRSGDHWARTPRYKF